MAQHFDLIIIGSGTGNSFPSPEFDDKTIAIIEESTFGGTCLNVGCIPTKMYVYTADLARDIDDAARFGITAHRDAVDWPSIVERVFAKRIDPISQGGEAYRRGPETPNIEVFDQHATFVDPHTIRTGQGDQECEITGDQIIIAAGSRPSIPPVVENSGVRYYTNEDIMRLPELPKSMVIIGGGYIASEFAHVFSSLGTTVTQLNRSDAMLRNQDEDVSARFTKLASEQWNVRLRCEATAIEETDQGVRLTLNHGCSIEAEVLLVATGRTSNADRLKCEAAGIDIKGGSIVVDEYGRTTVDGVWALGDVSSPFMLKHVANAEMRAVRHNLLHPDDLQPMPHDNVPAAVFTRPQIAGVGLTEKEAREAGFDITVKKQDYADVAYGWAMEDSGHFAKLIADRKTGKLLGAHFIGPQAATLIQQMITVISFGLDCRDVATKQYWIHPALPELTENALLGLDFS